MPDSRMWCAFRNKRMPVDRNLCWRQDHTSLLQIHLRHFGSKYSETLATHLKDCTCAVRIPCPLRLRVRTEETEVAAVAAVAAAVRVRAEAADWVLAKVVAAKAGWEAGVA